MNECVEFIYRKCCCMKQRKTVEFITMILAAARDIHLIALFSPYNIKRSALPKQE